MLGLSFAARFPERVSDLVLVGCGTYDSATRTIFKQSLDERLGDEGRRRVAEHSMQQSVGALEKIIETLKKATPRNGEAA